MKRSAILSAVLAAGLTLGIASSALAAPPKEVGRAPVAANPIKGLAQGLGNNIATMATCNVDGHPLLFIGGDLTTWVDHRGSHRISHLIAVDQTTTDLVWNAGGIGPGDTGFIRKLVCVSTSRTQARLYVGGSFSSMLGRTRHHTAALNVGAVSIAAPLKISLAGWTVPTTATIRALAATTTQVAVGGDTSVVAVSPYTAKQRWKVNLNCGTTSLLNVGNSLYVAGAFTKVTAANGSLAQYGVIKVDGRNGHLYKSFKPTFDHKGQKLCTDPTARGDETYKKTDPLSLAYDARYHHLIVGSGGHVNRLGAFTLKRGTTVWNRRMDGDVQTVLIYGGYVFAGTHRSGPNVGRYTYNYGNYGGFYALTNGRQALWQPRPDYTYGGANRDHTNNGFIATVLIGTRLCIGGGFRVPVQNFACHARA